MAHEPDPPAPLSPLSRRTVLAGVIGTSLSGMAWLSGCGGSGGNTVTRGTPVDSGVMKLTEPSASGMVLFPAFDAAGGTDGGYLITGTPQRMCFGLQTVSGDIVRDGPGSLSFAVRKDGKAVGAPIDTPRRGDGVPIGYYPVRTTFTDTGIYEVAVTVDGSELTQAIQVYEPTASRIPTVGSPLPAFETPTVDAARGVVPICTRKPDPCPFHDVTLAAALSEGRPVALMISTPEFCQIGVCGPVLELVIDAANRYPGITFVHAEVYEDAEARRGFQDAEPAPIMNEYGMTFEPCLFVTDASGTIVERLDNVFDRTDVVAALERSGVPATTTGSAVAAPGSVPGSTTGPPA